MLYEIMASLKISCHLGGSSWKSRRATGNLWGCRADLSPVGAVFMKQGGWRTRISSGAGVCVSVNVEVGPVGDTTGGSPEMTRAQMSLKGRSVIVFGRY